jgi:coenzyme F420-0:L-glutamate ligase/coenzyme F420-1:gamma-L-glutamate ligase
MIGNVSLSTIPTIPDICPKDDLALIIGNALEAHGVENGDILCIAHKIVSKAEGAILKLEEVKPSKEALDYGEKLNKNPKKVEIVLRQSKRVVRAFKRPQQNEGTMICEHHLGFISANAGVDESNSEPGIVITLPDDPDASARNIGQRLEDRFGVQLGIVITDTFGRPWRLGQVNVAIGLYRVPAITSDVGTKDAWGRNLSVTEPALCDELAAASGLLIKKAAKTPIVLFRGLKWTTEEKTSARDILRSNSEDMFR